MSVAFHICDHMLAVITTATCCRFTTQVYLIRPILDLITLQTETIAQPMLYIRRENADKIAQISEHLAHQPMTSAPNCANLPTCHDPTNQYGREVKGQLAEVTGQWGPVGRSHSYMEYYWMGHRPRSHCSSYTTHFTLCDSFINVCLFHHSLRTQMLQIL